MLHPGSKLVLAIVVLPQFYVALEAIELSALVEHPGISEVKISPGGEYLAVRVLKNGRHSLQFVSRTTREPTGSLEFFDDAEVGVFHWVNKNRVVVEKYDTSRVRLKPKFHGELYAIDADGSHGELIFGYRSGARKFGSRANKKQSRLAWGSIIDVLPDDHNNILISSTAMSEVRARKPKAVLLDVYTGVEKHSYRRSRYPMGRFLTDGSGELRLITSVKPGRKIHLQTKPQSANTWNDIPKPFYGRHLNPVAITEDKNAAYVLDNLNSDKIGLRKLSLDGLHYTDVYTHQYVDVSDVVLSSDGRTVYGLRVDDGYPSYILLLNKNKEAIIFKKLLARFPGKTLSITSRTSDGKYWVLRTGSDVNAGRFILYDREKDSLSDLFDVRPNLLEAELATVKPIEFKSFDGRLVAGYLTRAKTNPYTSQGISPLVVLVHGGPRERNYWQYDGEVQALATHGYSVLQINYRGSRGYGTNFMHAGNRQWGAAVIKDIIAGTRWAITQNYAQAGEICIMGTSFGAYAALQASIRAPNQFVCTIANAGIYDLSLLLKSGDVNTQYGGEAYLKEVIGTDLEELKRISPVFGVGALQSPVFIAHGTGDLRSPIKHALRLKKSLETHNKPFVWFIRSGEGHGFYDNRNKIEYLQAVLKFLDQHLSPARL